jgi:hypothetical protein
MTHVSPVCLFSLCFSDINRRGYFKLFHKLVLGWSFYGLSYFFYSVLLAETAYTQQQPADWGNACFFASARDRSCRLVVADSATSSGFKAKKTL